MMRTISMPWFGNEWRCGAQSYVVAWAHPMLWRGDQWMMIRQPHRGCTLDSPGLPTIGGYPGIGVGGMLPPWGLYFLSICALHATKTHRVAAKVRVSSRMIGDMTADNGGYDYGQWGI